MSDEGDIGWLREAIGDLQRGQDEILRILTDVRLTVARHDETIQVSRDQVAGLNACSKELAARVESVEKHMMPTAECLRLRNGCAAMLMRVEDKKQKHLSQWIALGAVAVSIISLVVQYLT